MTWAQMCAIVAHDLDRDLQAPARRAGGPRRLAAAGKPGLTQAFAGDEVMAGRFASARAAYDPVTAQARLAALGAWHIALDDDEYPKALCTLIDPPFGLFGQGSPISQVTRARPVVAIVGSRRVTRHGQGFARHLARALGEHGATVVSGLALGADAAAHEGALAANAPTIAILGSGIAALHPKRNSALRDRIVASGGTVASEYWVDTPPAPWRFPARNRIVAGLADAVVIVEAAERSGALITADFALDLGVPVLAVPGLPGAPMSAGCHALLRAGAALCESVDDVVAELPGLAWRSGGGDRTATDPAEPQDAAAAQLLELLAREPSRLDDLAGASGLAGHVIAATLGRLELAGLIHQPDGDRYAVRR